MRQSIITATVICLFAVLVFSCKKQAREKDTPIIFQTVEAKEKHHLNNDAKNPLLSIELKLQFPSSYPDDSILKKIRRAILADFFPDISDTATVPAMAMKSYIKDKIKLYEESEEIVSDEDLGNDSKQPQVAWWDKETMLIRYNANNLLSYTIESAQFSGGAHGGTIFRNAVFDLKTGDRLTEDDLFTEESRPLINEMLLKKLMAQNQVEKAEDLEQIGFFDVSEIGQYKNFYLTAEGIVYTFNEYEIAAYALGTIEVKLNYKDIASFLIPGSPIEPLIP
jgi:hypothetical protein